jgi:hypothetical protein
MNRLSFYALVMMTFALTAVSQAAAQNLILNPGFETDAVVGQEPLVNFATDWTQLFNNAASVSSPDIVRTGIGSLKLEGGGGFGVPGAYQSLPANPGEIWDLQGYMYIPTALPADITFGLLKIIWSDGSADLPPGEILIGQPGPAANPGIESLPFANSASPVGEWLFTQARGVAPPGTVSVSLFALFVDQSPGTVYFDDLQGSIVEDDGIPGDFDDDGDVDGRDFLVWQRGNSPSPLSSGDLTDWQTNYGTGGLGAFGAVPEPAGMTLLVLLSGLLASRKISHLV